MVEQLREGQERFTQSAMGAPHSDCDLRPIERPNGAIEAVPPAGASLVRWSIVYLVLIVAVWAFFGAGPQ